MKSSFKPFSIPGKKAASAPAPVPVKKAAAVPAPVPVKKAAAFSPSPIKKSAALTPAPVKKAAALTPAPVKKASALTPAPVKKATPAPAPVKKAAPAPVKAISSTPKPKLAPKPTAPVASNPNFAAGLIGSDIEAGEFDPFELSAGRSEETLLWWRAAELKHARICMLAALGLFIQPIIHLPDDVFNSVKGYGAATQVFEQRPWAIWQILIALAAIETSTLFSGKQGSGGDFDWDPLDLRKSQNLVGDKLDEMKLRELKNGRLAMLGTAGMLVQEFQTGGLSVYEQLN